jgi:hypothetical protein
MHYALTLIIVLTLPAALLFWVFIHPFVRFWRTVARPGRMAWWEG